MLMSERNCPLGLTSSDVKETEPNRAVSDPVAARSRYGFGEISKKRQERVAAIVQQEETGEKPSLLRVIKHGDFEFHECPVPTITEGLMDEDDRFANFAVNIVNWAEQSGNLPAEGGLLDQANLFYECRMIVVGEQNKIEHEKHEESQRKSKENSKPVGGRKTPMGRRT